jgi:hypothetical protein
MEKISDITRAIPHEMRIPTTSITIKKGIKTILRRFNNAVSLINTYFAALYEIKMLFVSIDIKRIIMRAIMPIKMRGVE